MYTYHERLCQNGAFVTENPQTGTEISVKYWDRNYARDYSDRCLDLAHLSIRTKSTKYGLMPTFCITGKGTRLTAGIAGQAPTVLSLNSIGQARTDLEMLEKDLMWIKNILAQCFPEPCQAVSPN